mgnify:CR=1 FL=1
MTSDGLTSQQKRMALRWQRYVSPIRPSKGMVELYEKNIGIVIKNKFEYVWGLLGCTPEIRSIAGKYQAKITCIDRNPDAFYAFKTICEPSKYESFICSDWLSLNLDEMFDIVLGDGAMSMLPIEEHGTFLKNIHKIIKPGGYAVLRIHTIVPLPFDSPKKIFDWYRNKNDITPIFSTLWDYLYSLWLNLDTLNVSHNVFLSKLLEVYKAGLINLEELEKLITDNDYSVLVQYSRKEIFEKQISGFFQIESVDYAGDYPLHRNHPIYFLRKK